jgi:hypothetical protein
VETLGRQVMRGKGEETTMLVLDFSAYKGGMAHGGVRLSRR